MKTTNIDKVCEVCGDLFTPDSRVGERQRVCKKPSCKQERKRRAQHRWVSNNPDYFKDRYDYFKGWLAIHPGYLQTYRQRKKLQAQVSRRDIQDELTSCKNGTQLPLIRYLCDIQDEITTCFSRRIWLLQNRVPVIYKTS